MNPYPHGQCTWGAAEMCSCLQNLSQYGNFGNGGDWFHHAQSIGLPTSPSPQVGWLASFSVSGWPDGPGDVGLIIGINPDGTITRYGTNWHLDGAWSTDKVAANLVIGSFKAPCNCIGPNATLFSATGPVQGQTNCTTFSWSVLGSNLCFDGILGVIATGGGLALIAIGVVIMIAGTLTRKSVTKQQSQSQTTTQPEQLPSEQEMQQMSAQEHDAIILRARQRAQARNLQYRQRQIARMPTRQEGAAKARGTTAGTGARVGRVVPK